MLFLDIETTGLDFSKHQILSLGMLYVDKDGNETEFLENCKHKEYTVTSEALNVNKINLASHEGLSLQGLQDSAIHFLIHSVYKEITTKVIDETLKNKNCASPYQCILDTIKKDKKNKLTPIGYNVGSFDMLFLKKYLTDFYSFFDYLSVDINSLIYLEANIKGVEFNDLKKYYFDKFLMNHNALDDCKKSYEAYKEIKANLTRKL